MKGLGARKTADAIAAFVKEHGADGPRRAVLCTYDFDPTRFEAVLLPALTRRGRWFRTLVLADGAALQKEGVLAHRAAEATYELAPVRLRGPGVFHPKLSVIQAGANILVGVGSGNLTPGGLGGNLELMLFASTATADGRALAASALQFLDDLRRAPSLSMPQPARRLLERLCVSASRSAGGPLLHSLDAPLLGQLAARRPHRITRTFVVSPWHSSAASAEGVEPAVLQAVTRALGVRPVVYTEGEPRADGKGMNGPALGKKVDVHVLKAAMRQDGAEIDADDDEDADKAPRRPARLHAKAYLAAGKGATTLWFGSANCTTPALLQAAKGNGNVELLVQVSLDLEDLAAIQGDLDDMFEPKAGDLKHSVASKNAPPRGAVLAGYVGQWGGTTRLRLELVPLPTASTLVLSATAKLTSLVTVQIPPRSRAHTLDPTTTMKLFGPTPASVLWEQAGARALAFPVSVPCVLADGDPEASLDDLLRDLAGRIPVAHEASRRRRRRNDDERDSEEVDDPRDPELALLTRTAHEGLLDRMAVRVELLRRRLTGALDRTDEARAHYRGVIDALSIPARYREILVAHLGVERRPR